ncbi:hypothetical protein TYRP_021270 [Tyrophagus putrescentiae]|nr:hypothetical protein TYRP_021270 [Tyrophagus putrescentiae]
MNSSTFFFVIATVAALFCSSCSLAASITAGSPNAAAIDADLLKDCPKMLNHVMKCFVELGLDVTKLQPSQDVSALLCCKDGSLKNCLGSEMAADPTCKPPVNIAQVDFSSTPVCANVTASEAALCGQLQHQIPHSGATLNSFSAVSIFALLLAIAFAFFAGGN